MQRVAVVGGGIAGLTVALRRAQAGDQVVVFEAGAQVGGQLWSESQAGFLIEHGAEGFVARSEVVPSLAADAGIAHHIVEQLEQRSFRVDGTNLVELAPGEAGRLLGFQVPADELGRGIRSFRHGMGELPRRLASSLGVGVELRVNSRVRGVTSGPGGVTLCAAGDAPLTFDVAVIATTARSAATLLEGMCGRAARALDESTLLSSLTVTLAYRRDAIAHPLNGTGFIVPEPERLSSVRAVTFSSSKLPHRSPPEHALLRVFFRPTDDELATLSDASWSERAERALAAVLGVNAPAERAFISRWPRALPVFDPAHRARISALEAALNALPIRLAGAAFHGSGIDAAIRSAEAAAQAIAVR